jgi:CHASE2 domain-containing sensor protein
MGKGGENNMSNTDGSKNEIGFSSLLTLIFITLKLLSVITWSWIWVLAPLWIPVLCALIIFVITVIRLTKKKLAEEKENKEHL